MKNLSLRIKLVGGFSLVAVIIVIIGFVSIAQQNKLTKATEILEKDAVAAVDNVLNLKNKSAEVVIDVRTILSPYLTVKERANIQEKIKPIREEVAIIQRKFVKLPFFNTIQPEWEQYLSSLDKWINANNRAIALSNDIAAADIANPEQLVKDMQDFEIAHKDLLNKVNGLLFLHTDFAGGTDFVNCSLGRWLANMPTGNPEIVAEMEKVRPIHKELHQQVGNIKKLVAAGQTGQAQLLLQNRLLPLSEQVFISTRKVTEISKKYHDTFEQLSTILLNEVNKYQQSTFAALDNIVDKAERYAKESAEKAQIAADTGKTISFICMIVGTVLALLLGFILTTIITRPLFKGVELVESMANGDMTRTLDIKQKDEIGRLAESLNNMARQLHHMLTNIGKDARLVSQSSLELTDISRQMTGGAEDSADRSSQVAAAAEEMSANQNSVAAAMEEASVNVNMVATATEEMKSTIIEISENSGRAKQITSQAVEKSQVASNRVDKLGQAADEINKVTEAITEISEQTNLLALNATIEAARAGEAGKGFAVVASEIKDLAGQTAKATFDIQAKIQDIQQATTITIEEINEISTVISEVDQVVATIAAAVEEQSATTGEIAENITQVSQGISEVNENVAQSSTVSAEIASDIAEVSNRTNEMAVSSNSVKDMAENLSGVAGKLQEMVARFKV